MSFNFNQVIGMIGGVPILKNVLGHTIDKLKIPRHLDIGTPQNILSSVFSGGIGSLLQSPLGSALTPLTSTITSALSSISSVTGVASLTTALTSLSSSATGLSALADNLAGVTSSTGLPTLMDAVSHMSVMQAVGSSVPSNLSLATVLAPIQSAGLLTSAQLAVTTIVPEVVAGTMTVASAVTAVQAAQASLDAVTNASTSAVSTVQAAQPALCAAQSAIALLVGGTSDMVAAMQVAIRPDMLATVQEVVAARNANVAASAASQSVVSAAVASIVEAQAAAVAQTANVAPFTS